MDAAQELAERRAVIDQGLSYVGTPYHHRGTLRGVGVDCITFLLGAFQGARVLGAVELPRYPRDWHLHRDQERYMTGLLKYCVETAPASERTPKPADIVLYKFGRAFSHGVLVLEWPKAIHAYVGVGVTEVDALRLPMLTVIGERVEGQGQPRPSKVFRFERWAN